MKKVVYTCVLSLSLIAIYTTKSCECLEEKQKSVEDDAMKVIAAKYFSKISNIDSKYIINEGLSRTISKILKGKVNTFPLYKISLSIDPKPVKIPWTLDQGSHLDGPYSKKYKYYKNNKNTQM